MVASSYPPESNREPEFRTARASLPRTGDGSRSAFSARRRAWYAEPRKRRDGPISKARERRAEARDPPGPQPEGGADDPPRSRRGDPQARRHRRRARRDPPRAGIARQARRSDDPAGLDARSRRDPLLGSWR